MYVPHAMWLLENDQFNEAQDGNNQLGTKNRVVVIQCCSFVALSKAGRQTAAVNILEQLVENAIVETRCFSIHLTNMQ